MSEIADSEVRHADKLEAVVDISVAFSPDGADVATASDDRTVVTCGSWTGQRRQACQTSTAVSNVAYSPKCNYQ